MGDSSGIFEGIRDTSLCVQLVALHCRVPTVIFGCYVVMFVKFLMLVVDDLLIFCVCVFLSRMKNVATILVVWSVLISPLGLRPLGPLSHMHLSRGS